MKRKTFHTTVMILAGMAALAAAVQAETLVLQQGLNGYSGCEDTYIRGQGYNDNNYGAATVLYTMGNVNTTIGDACQAMIRFNNLFGDGVNQVPAGAVITHAELQMYTYMTSTRQYALRWYQMQRDWVAGSGTGAPEVGASCANYRMYSTTPSGSDFWGTAGVPRVGPLSSSTNPPTNGGDYYNYYDPIRVETLPPATLDWMTWDVTGFVQRWQYGAIPNDGLLSYSMDGYLRIRLCSSEYVVATLRPKLVIEYEPLPENTVAFQQGLNGYSGCEDTYIRGVSYEHDYSDNNYGASTLLYTGANVNFTAFGQSAQAMIRFNNLFGDGVNQVPQSAVITSATLKMYTALTSTRQYALRWYQMQRDWVEGSSSGTPEAGASCASYRQYATSPSGNDFWGTDGVASTRLGPLGSATNPPTNDADYYDYMTIDGRRELLVADRRSRAISRCRLSRESVPIDGPARSTIATGRGPTTS